MLVTEWPEFRKLDLEEVAGLMAQPILVDGRNMFEPDVARAAGFDYTGIGRADNSRANGRKNVVQKIATI